MKYFPFPFSAGTLRSLALASLLTSTLFADVALDETVKEGPIPNVENGIEVSATDLAKWPAEVKISTYPLDVYSQLAGSVLGNEEIAQAEGSSFTSRVVGQEFQVGDQDGDQILEEIFIVAVANLQNGSGGIYHLRMVDLGMNAVTGEYEEGKNLLSEKATIEPTTPFPADQTQARICSLKFSGMEKLRLKAGNSYAFEIVADPANTPQQKLNWYRSSRRDLTTVANPDARLFVVSTTPESKITDVRDEMKERQAYIGIRTSKAP